MARYIASKNVRLKQEDIRALTELKQLMNINNDSHVIRRSLQIARQAKLKKIF